MSICVDDLIIDRFKPIKDLIFSFAFLHFWFKGGRGSTKSSFIAIMLVLLMVLDPEFNAVCIRKVAETLQDSVYNQILWAIEMLGLKRYFQFKLSPMQIIYKPTGQRFYFRGCDKPEKIKSIKCKAGKLKAVWFEELAEFSGMKEIRTVTQSIIRGGEKFLCFYSFNPPKDAHNWVNEEVEKEINNRYVSHSTYLDVPREWLGDDFINEAENLKANKPDEFDNEYLGQTSKLSLNVVRYFTAENIRNITYNDTMPLHITCDFNVDPMMWVLAHKTAEKVFFFDEIVKENTCTSECLKLFIDKYGNHKGKIIINGDASGSYRRSESEYTNYAQMLNKLKAHFGDDRVELDIHDANPPIKARVNAFNQRVKSDSGILNVYVDPKCIKLLYNVKNLKYKEGTSDIAAPSVKDIQRDSEKKHLGHIFDAASYLIEFYWPIFIK